MGDDAPLARLNPRVGENSQQLDLVFRPNGLMRSRAGGERYYIRENVLETGHDATQVRVMRRLASEEGLDAPKSWGRKRPPRT